MQKKKKKKKKRKKENRLTKLVKNLVNEKAPSPRERVLNEYSV